MAAKVIVIQGSCILTDTIELSEFSPQAIAVHVFGSINCGATFEQVGNIIAMHVEEEISSFFVLQ